MELLDIMLRRRSVRKYTAEAIPEETLQKILQAGLLAPSSRDRRPCEFYVVRDRKQLKRLSRAKAAGAAMLADAAAAIAVFGDPDKADTWIEDCSIALTYMDLMAASQGVGSCWTQMHLRQTLLGKDAEESVKEIVGAPASYRIVGVLSLGMPQGDVVPHTLESLDWNKVHTE